MPLTLIAIVRSQFASSQSAVAAISPAIPAQFNAR
jgi:hypothetical protein